MNDLSQREKKMILTGVGIIGGILILSSLTSKKTKSLPKSEGIEISDQCNSYKITDPDLFARSLRSAVKSSTKSGTVDPFAVARSFLKRIAPSCSFYPSNTRNPGEAKLFVRVLDETLEVMKEESLLSAQQQSTFRGMAEVWATAQGVPVNDL